MVLLHDASFIAIDGGEMFRPPYPVIAFMVIERIGNLTPTAVIRLRNPGHAQTPVSLLQAGEYIPEVRKVHKPLRNRKCALKYLHSFPGTALTLTQHPDRCHCKYRQVVVAETAAYVKSPEHRRGIRTFGYTEF